MPSFLETNSENCLDQCELAEAGVAVVFFFDVEQRSLDAFLVQPGRVEGLRSERLDNPIPSALCPVLKPARAHMISVRDDVQDQRLFYFSSALELSPDIITGELGALSL